MKIRIRETGAVVYEDEFRRMNAHTSFPLVLSVATLNDFGADPVLEGAQPTPTDTQYVVQEGVENIGGTWFTKWVVKDYTAKEIAERHLTLEEVKKAQVAHIKREASNILAKTDWMVIRLAETAVAIPADWEAYRDAIRRATDTAEAAIVKAKTHAEVHAVKLADIPEPGAVPVQAAPDVGELTDIIQTLMDQGMSFEEATKQAEQAQNMLHKGDALKG